MRAAEFRGEYVTVWPYLRGWYERDILYKLWTLIEADGPDSWPRIFWDNPHDETPVSKFGDLVDFIAFVEAPGRSWLIVKANDTAEICGLLWFDKQTQDSAFANIWMARAYRGRPHTRDTVKMAAEYGFYARGWRTLYGMSPWKVVSNLVRRCGWKHVADIPEIHKVMGEPASVYLHKITKEDFDGK